MSENILADLLDAYVSVRSAAAALGVSRQRVVVLCQRGQLPGARLTYGRWLIPRVAVDSRKNLRENFGAKPKTQTPQEVAKE
jgi:hypothetical protein